MGRCQRVPGAGLRGGRSSDGHGRLVRATRSRLDAWFAGLLGFPLFSLLFEDAGLGAGYLGQPHICSRFMAIREPRELRPACVLSMREWRIDHAHPQSATEAYKKLREG